MFMIGTYWIKYLFYYINLLNQEKILASSTTATTDSVRNVTVATDIGVNSSCKVGPKSNSIMTPNIEGEVNLNPVGADQPASQPIILPSSIAFESTNNIESLVIEKNNPPQ